MLIKPGLPLICPICKKVLIEQDNQLCCDNNHSYDVARQGYINLLPVQHKKSKDPGDSKEMISARQQFLETGAYLPVAEKLNKIVLELLSGNKMISILDAGCGEGFYLDLCYKKCKLQYPEIEFRFLGLDISKPAIMASAKRNKNITWVVGTNKAPPVVPHTFDIVFCMFGFCDLDIISKVLKPDGKVILVDAGSDHLLELRLILYPHIKESRSKVIPSGFNLINEDSVKYIVKLNKDQITNLLVMTPHLYRASKIGKEQAMKLQQINLTVDVMFRVLQKDSE